MMAFHWLNGPMPLDNVRRRGVLYCAARAAMVIGRRGTGYVTAVTLKLDGSVALENPATAKHPATVGCYAHGIPGQLYDKLLEDLKWMCDKVGIVLPPPEPLIDQGVDHAPDRESTTVVRYTGTDGRLRDRNGRYVAGG